MHEEKTIERFIELRSQGWPFARLSAELNVSKPSTPQLHSLARNLRRQMEQAAGPVRFTSPVREIPDDEYHAQVQAWQG